MNLLLVAGRRSLVAAYRWFRAVSGDDAYEQYMRRLGHQLPVTSLPAEAHRAKEGHESRLSFYLARLQRKYSGVSRCC